MHSVKGQIILSIALAASSFAWANDPTIAPTNFNNIDPAAVLGQKVGNFSGAGTTHAAGAPATSVGSFNSDHVLMDRRTTGGPNDFPPPPPSSKSEVVSGSINEKVEGMSKKSMSQSQLAPDEARPTSACGYVGFAMDFIEPTDAQVLAAGAVKLNRDEASKLEIKDVILFTSRSENPQSIAYVIPTRKFYRLDPDNTLVEIAIPYTKGGPGRELYSLEQNRLVDMQGVKKLISLSLKALASDDGSASKSASSLQVGCEDSPNWYVQRLGDKRKKSKARSAESTEFSWPI